MSTTILRVGDAVLWRGAWGFEEPKTARVAVIELVERGQKNGGVPVDAVPWSAVPDHVVVTLDNNHWAYGRQLQPVPPESPEADCMLDSRGTCLFHHVNHAEAAG